VRSLLANRVYLGEACCGQHYNPDAHAALVDAVTWRLAQYEPKRRSNPNRPGLLYGLLRCASCRSLMTISADKGDRLYRCSRKPHQRGACPKKTYITATTIETFAEDLLFSAARRRPRSRAKPRPRWWPPKGV
jgi:hypothetical protein